MIEEKSFSELIREIHRKRIPDENKENNSINVTFNAHTQNNISLTSSILSVFAQLDRETSFKAAPDSPLNRLLLHLFTLVNDLCTQYASFVDESHQSLPKFGDISNLSHLASESKSIQRFTSHKSSGKRKESVRNLCKF